MLSQSLPLQTSVCYFGSCSVPPYSIKQKTIKWLLNDQHDRSFMRYSQTNHVGLLRLKLTDRLLWSLKLIISSFGLHFKRPRSARKCHENQIAFSLFKIFGRAVDQILSSCFLHLSPNGSLVFRTHRTETA